MATLTPYIKSEDARAQAEFYTQALGGEILSVMTHGQLPNADEATKDKVLHLSFVAGGITFFMSEFTSHGPLHQGNGISLALGFASDDELRDAFAKLSQGGQVLHPLGPAFWGGLHGDILDKYGVSWMLANEAPASQS